MNTELAWAAGFFEGEGTVSSATTRGKLRIRAAVTQHGGDEAKDMLQRFVNAVGVGKVLGPYDYTGRYPHSNLGKKPRFQVQYQNRRDVVAVMEKLGPYMTATSPKFIKYRHLLAEVDDQLPEHP